MRRDDIIAESVALLLQGVEDRDQILRKEKRNRFSKDRVAPEVDNLGKMLLVAVRKYPKVC